MYFALFLVAINLFKLSLARYFPLIGDEAFYWVWSQHLDLSYIAHPPMIAYFNFILTSIFGQSELAIRLGAISLVLIISCIIYLTGKELFDARAGRCAAVIFNLLPTFFGGGMFLVPQTILFLFWSVSFYLLARIVRTFNLQLITYSWLWYVLGVAVGLGLLSDYVMSLFFIGTFVFLLFNKEQRFWLTRKEPYLGALLALLVFSPVIIWNLRQGFAPFFYWGGKMGAGPRIADNLLNFFGLQAVLFTPPIFIMTFWKPATERRGSQTLLSIFSYIVFLPFALISPLVNVGGHWAATAYLPAILSVNRLKKPTLALILFFALLVNILGLTYYIFLYPTPAEFQGKEFTINHLLPQFIKDSTPKSGRTFCVASDIGTFGLVSFHGRVKVYSPPGLSREMEAWGRLELKRGDNVLYFARENTGRIFEELKPLFRRVWLEPQKRLFTKDADIPNKLQIFHCENYLGGNIP